VHPRVIDLLAANYDCANIDHFNFILMELFNHHILIVDFLVALIKH